jgi:dsRNA-specific ribonuclease
VECAIAELNLRTLGSGNSRRLAEQEAAGRAYEILNRDR